MNKNIDIAKELLKKEKFLKENNLEEYIKQIYLFLNNDCFSMDYYLKDCYKLIDLDLKEAIKLFNILKKKNISLKNEETFIFLNNRINNKIEYNNFDDRKKEQIIEYKRYGKYYYENEDLENALYHYEIGLYLTDYNEFNYYIGKILYKLGDYEASKEYLLKYNLTGTDKLSKSFLYLSIINKRLGNISKNEKMKEKIRRLSLIEDNNFVIEKRRGKNYE